MNSYFVKIKIITTIFLFALLPSVLFAQTGKQICSSDGYTITTINGVFTDENGAIANRDALKYYFEDTYNGETLTVHYLLNPSHLGGVGDILVSAYQKAFENETVSGYDLVEMLKDASAKVKTQKLLLVAHSQGNFYANSFYDEVVDKVGGVPTQSIGIYSVANPASRVAGNGKWMTSDTDKVISTFVASVPFKKIMPPNVHIELQPGDNFAGHGFSDAYLKYKSGDIVIGIQSSLDKLLSDPARREDSLCIDPPKLTIAHKVAGVALAVADPVANAGVTTVATTAKAGIFVVVTTVKAGVIATVWTYHAGVATAIWSYNATVAVGKAVGNATVAVASTVYNAVAGALSSGALASNNSAAVILATMPTQTQKSTLAKNQVATVTNPVIQPLTVSNQSLPVAPPQPQAVFVFEPKVQGDTSAPKLVFVGSFPFGGGVTTPQVLGTQSTASVVEEVAVAGGGGAGDVLTAPVLSAPQCVQTLATDGCLLATTTVRFEWAPVLGASYYATIKNGEYATTTDTQLDIVVRDFSDYTLEVVAVDAGGQASATSTQAVSVATIPIAINEIAWMGTRANTNDEWFEIKNNTARTIDLAQWEINAKYGAPQVKLAGTIAPHAYLIFERTDDSAVADVAMHKKFTNELENTGDKLILSYASTTFDQTPDGAWAAGATSTRKTMERYSSRESGADASNWGTNLGYIKNGKDAKGTAIEGTPGAQNSVSTLINKGEDITSDFTLTADEERYVVTSDGVWVQASTTLTIEPGVTVSFYPDAGDFFIQGAVDAQGTVESPIVFNSFSGAQEGGFWVDNATATSTFDHVRFENTESIVVSGSDIEVRNSEFVHTDGGVEAYENATIFIENTYFASSTSDTIGAYDGSTVHIASSTITNQLDDDAIGIYDGSSLIMSSTTIDGVHDGSGIYAYDAFISIASSTIRNTESTAIALSNGTTTVANTLMQGGALNDGDGGISIDGGTATITDTTVFGFTEGAGVSVSLQHERSYPYMAVPGIVAVISDTEITGNATGIEMEAGSVKIDPSVSVHDNGTSVADNIVVW
ncbi:MAG: right-handed parallel beta-helix repeat-containing protein [Patescibacteria group bacterium]|mgnify:CR=1 FL=1